MNNLFEMFQEEFEARIPQVDTHHTCQHEFIQDDGVYICQLCFTIQPLIVNSHEFAEPLSTIYKRITHIKSNLTRFIGREEFYLPEYILSTIKKFNPITIQQVRQLLKTQGLSKYYIHIYSISSKLGIKIPYLSQAEYDKCVFHFNLFNSVYSKIYTNRNCLNYHFILSKIFQKIRRTDLLPYLHFGSNKHKISHYEKIWNECSTCCK